MIHIESHTSDWIKKVAKEHGGAISARSEPEVASNILIIASIVLAGLSMIIPMNERGL